MTDQTQSVNPTNTGVRGTVLSISQLAEYLNCHAETARQTTNQDRFPAPVMIGRRRFWLIAAVDSFFKITTN